ncbi:MAG: HNH endonuclease signature motif containing protein [Deltaproteobacteria bacterium]
MAEIERRKLYIPRGFSSLFRFCVEGLGLTEDQACRRVAVVRAAARVPDVLPLLASGELHMTGVAKLSKFMTDDNAHSLVEQARNRSKAEVELMIATEFPGAKSTDDRVEAATAETFNFRFDGSAEAKALLDRAKELTPPGTDIGEIFEAALALYVAKLERRKNGRTSRPRSLATNDAPAGAAYVPAATRRAVVERDGARCTYVGSDGRRCSERSNLEFDHVGGRALGGKSIPSELRLLCRSHNLHAAREVFGHEFVDRRIRERRSTLTGQGRYSGRAGAVECEPSGVHTQGRD